MSQVNPHRFRHTFATWAIRVNARELDVQYLAWSFEPDDGPSLLRNLRLRAGGSGARYLQPGEAAVGVRRALGARPPIQPSTGRETLLRGMLPETVVPLEFT